MSQEFEEKLNAMLLNLMNDGFNRSIGALREAGAIDTKEMDAAYSGIGSQYYDLVTEQMQITMSYAKTHIHELVEKHKKID